MNPALFSSRTKTTRLSLLAASGVLLAACAPDTSAGPRTLSTLAPYFPTGESGAPRAAGPLVGGSSLERGDISQATSALVVASRGVRRLFVGLERRRSELGGRDVMEGERSRLGYAYSDDAGASWTRQQVPATRIASFGLDSLVGAPAVAAFPTVPMSRAEPPAQDSMVYLVGLAGGASSSEDPFRSLVIARSPDGGTRFSALYPFPPTGLSGGVPTSPSITVDEGGLVHVAYLLDAGTPIGRVAYTRGGWVSRGGSAPSPEFRVVATVGLGFTETERAQLRRVIVRAGDGAKYIAVERVVPLPPERVTPEHDAQLRLMLLRERPLSEGLEWDPVEVLNEGSEVLLRARDTASGPATGGIDFQRVRTRHASARDTAEAGSMGANHLVWAGHYASDPAGVDHVYYQSFTSDFGGATGYVESFGPRLRLDETAGAGRAVQPALNADGNELFVSWLEYEAGAPTRGARRMVRHSADYGRTWEEPRAVEE